MNLAVNARDAMPEGGRLRLRLSQVLAKSGQSPPLPEMDPGLWVRLTVTDNGTGIEPRHLSHIFDPFFTTKPAGQGTGLGLAQVHGIVHQHGGHIAVESRLGQGTTFTIYLPVLDKGEKPKSVPEVSTLPASTSPATILLVEDDPTSRAAVQELLESLGHRVLAASTGREGLTCYEQEKTVDLVVSDLVMPDMGGVALYRALQASYPQLRMLIMTGYPLADGGRQLLEQGIVGWLQKPFSSDQLADKVRTILSTVG
jgi:two-component system cell cycle sensor histidine kinase/response regulator CckA